MAVNGDFIQGYGAGKAAGLPQKVAEAVTDWLEENVDPDSGYVIDKSLTVENAAADAKKVGDEVGALKSAVNDPATGLDSKAPAIYDTASGAIASFEDGADGMPVKRLTVNIEPVQAAGTPSPENPLPISGWTGCNIYHSGEDTSDPTTYTIQLGDTVYGGTLDVTTGVLTVTHILFNRNSSTMNNDSAYPGWKGAGLKTIGYTGSGYVNTSLNVGTQYAYNCSGNNDILFLGIGDYHLTQEEWQALALDIQIVIPLVTFIEIPITPTTQIETLLGTNNIWADTGPVSVDYPADTKLYINNKIAAAIAAALNA